MRHDETTLRSVRSRLLVVLVAALLASAAGLGAFYATRPSPPPGASTGTAAGGAIAAARSLTWSAEVVGTATFSATACAGAHRCFAFGLGGALATSNDGGGSWSVSQLPITSRLTVLATTCPSTERCVALAEPDPAAGSVVAHPATAPGVALVSNNGGRSWRPAPVPGSAVQFTGGLACPSARDCYATARGTGRIQPGFLLVSTDGGADWALRRQGPAGDLSEPTGGLGSGLACPSVSRCYATGGPGGIVVTDDGGLRWSAESEPDAHSAVGAIDGLACSSLTSCTGVGSAGQMMSLPAMIATRDGGSSWRADAAVSASSAARDEAVEGGSFQAVNCSGQRCAALASTGPALGLLATSNDGGASWQESLLPPGDTLNGVTCAASGGCVVAGDTSDGSPLLALVAGGQRWSTRDLGPPTDQTALTCSSPGHCLAAEPASPVPLVASVTETDDGGARWSPVGLPVGLTGIAALDCPTARRCLALADVPVPPQVHEDGGELASAILSSDDGGRSWRRDVLAAPAGTSLDALSCPTVTTCFAAGATPGGIGVMPQDAIVTSTDGGLHWRAEQLPAFPPQPPTGTSGSEILEGGLTGIACFGPTRCLAGGPAGVLATTDGTQWSLRFSTPGPDNGGVVSGGMLFGELQLFTCASALRCVAVVSTPNGNGVALDLHRRWPQLAARCVTGDRGDRRRLPRRLGVLGVGREQAWGRRAGELRRRPPLAGRRRPAARRRGDRRGACSDLHERRLQHTDLLHRARRRRSRRRGHRSLNAASPGALCGGR